MTTSTNHAKVVLAGVLPKRLDLLRELTKEVTEDYFTDPIYAKMFALIQNYYQRVDGVMTRNALMDMLNRSNLDPGRKAVYEETFDDLVALDITDAEFMWSVHELREDYAESNLKGLLTKSMEIVTKGVLTNDRTGETLKGQEDAREYLLSGMANLDQELSRQESPHGDMRDEGSLILAEYEEKRAARAANKLAGVRFGIRDLDEKVGGLQPGELVISAGYSSDGKTSLCVQLAWSTAVEQGKNVLFLSTETVNTVIRRKLISRHSRHPKFADWGLPEGLNSKNLKEGTLNAHEQEFLEHVVYDFTNAEEYGHLYIHQVPRMASMEVVEQIMNATQKKFNVDLVVIDYLALLRPLGVRSTDRESLAGILKNAKQIATTFNKGAGVPIISPWQVNRASKEAANSIGMYTSQSLAETAEATNTPDVIISLLAPVDNTERYADITAQVLKNRDGETANGILLEVDYATSTFSSKTGFTSLSSVSLVGASSEDSFAGLLG